MLVKIEARILIFPGTDFHFPSTSVPPGTFLGSGQHSAVLYTCLPWLLSKYDKHGKLLFFACFRFLIFHPFSQGGQLTPMCGRPWAHATSGTFTAGAGGWTQTCCSVYSSRCNHAQDNSTQQNEHESTVTPTYHALSIIPNETWLYIRRQWRDFACICGRRFSPPFCR